MWSGLVDSLQSAVNQIADLNEHALILVLIGAVAALVLTAVWRAANAIGERFEHFDPKSYTVKHSTDNYVLMREEDAPRDSVNKKTELKIRYRDNGRMKVARGVLRFTTASDYPVGTLGLPNSVLEVLGLSFSKALENCDLEITVQRRFPLAAYWYHPEDSIRISTRTTFWVTALTTIIGVLTAYLFEHVFCRGCGSF